MAGFSIGPISFGGGSDSSTNQPYIEYYQSMADGTHLVRQALDPKTNKPTGSALDEGLHAAKTAPTDKPVVKTLTDGSTWAYAFNPDGTVKDSTKLSDAQGKPVDPSLEAQRDAKTQQIDQQSANAAAMMPYNQQKAQALINNLNARTDLLPAQRDLINARVSRIQSQNAVDTSRIGLNESQADKNKAQADYFTVEGQAKLKNIFYQAQQEINSLYGTVGQPGGPPDKAAADALAEQIMQRTAREAATGISAQQDAANQLTAQRQAMEQGNNRAGEAGADFRQMMSTGAELGKNGASARDIGSFLAGSMGVAPNFQAQMGGAPVPVQGAGAAQGAATFGGNDFQNVLSLLKSGQVPPDANGNYLPNALKMARDMSGVPGTSGGSGANGQILAAPGMTAPDVNAQQALAGMEN